MALYLNRRHGVPGWEVGSSMLFIMFCELLYLTFWALVGYAIAGDELPPQFRLVPWVALGVFAAFAVWVAYFRGWIAPGSRAAEQADPEGVPRGGPAALCGRRRAALARAARGRDRLHARAAPVRRRRELRAHARRPAA